MIIKIQNSEHNIYLKHSENFSFFYLLKMHQLSQVVFRRLYLYLKSVLTPLSNLFTLYLEEEKKKTQSNNRNKLQVDRPQHPIHQKLKSKRIKKHDGHNQDPQRKTATRNGTHATPIYT